MRGPRGVAADPGRGSVRLHRSALVAMALAAVEVDRRECVGLLLGRRGRGGVFCVEQAIAYQVADRGARGVRAARESHRRLCRAVADLGRADGTEMLGDFHSHAAWGDSDGVAAPSAGDIADMLAGHVHVVVAVNASPRRAPLRANADGTVSGGIAGRRIRVAAFALAPDAARTSPCPSTNGARRAIALPIAIADDRRAASRRRGGRP